MMSLGEPGLPLEECRAEGMVLGGSLEEECDDEVGQRVNEEVSEKLSCVDLTWPGHEH